MSVLSDPWTVHTHPENEGFPFQAELEDLRAEAVMWVAGAAFTANFLLLLGVGAADLDLGRHDVWLVTATLSGLAAASLVRLRRSWSSPRLAAALLIAGLLGTVASASLVYGWRQLVFLLPLVVFVAPLLVGVRGALATAAAALAMPLALVEAKPGLLGPDDVAAALAFSVAAAALGAVAFRPMRTMLGWSWRSYLAERHKTEEVRHRQAELAALTRSLSEANDRLEHANIALAQARRQADEARRLKDEFAVAISHELRTPLNLIVGFTEMIANGQGGPALPDDLRDDVATVYRNALHLSDLVDDVLDLGRLDAHRLALQKDWARLEEIVHGATASVAGLYEKAGLGITVDLPPETPKLYVDQTRVRQVLINLLANAVRYTEEGGATVVARREGPDLLLSVADSGIGIPAADLPNVFEPFKQTGQASRRGGFGLGLTISKRFVEMHGGAMWVESEPGRGSTFSFSLPITDNVAALAAEPNWGVIEGPRGQERHRTVLVLDHEVESVRIIRRYLDDLRVVAATTPAEAARHARNCAVGAVVVANPAIAEGDALMRAAVEHLPRTPLLRCTLRTVGRAGRELGAAAFLTKPVSREQLRATLKRLGLRPRRPLIVDDDPDMVRLLGRMLHQVAPRCRVLSTTSGEAGLALARMEAPDLVLVDLLMPGMDGHAFLRAWHAEPALATVPAIIVSAASEEDHDLVTGESLEIRREGGLSVADLMRALRGALDGLMPTDPERGSSAYVRRAWPTMADDGRSGQTGQPATVRLAAKEGLS